MTTPLDRKNWWLLTTKIHKEEYAADQLTSQGYITYRPLAQRLRKNRGKMKMCIESLFPRYIFIQLNKTTDDWSPIRSTRGIINFVRFGENYAQVPDDIIKALQEHESTLSNKAIELDRYNKGDKIIIEQEGAYKNLQGVFQQYKGDQSCSILITILNSRSFLNISPTEIAPL